jgi:hypothetical protein
MAKWHKRSAKLPVNHGWRAKPGNNVFVADRGAVRLDFPEGWVVEPGEGSIKFHDKKPPDDDCVLEVSYLRLPPIDWSGLPLAKMLAQVLERDDRGTLSTSEIVQVRRTDLELAWAETRFTDPNENREAVSRTCLARGQGIQALLTFAFWPEDLARCAAVWDEALRSLQLGMWMKDPRGPTLH